MTPSRGTFTFLVTLLVALGLPALFLLNDSQDTGREAPPLAPPPVPPPVLRWNAPGARYAFALQSRVLFGALADRNALPTISLVGTLNVRVLSSDGQSLRAALRLHPLSCDIQGTPRPEEAARMSQPFFARIAANGRIEELFLPASLPEGEQAILEEAIRSLQIVVPGNAHSWTTRETHRTGDFEALYEATPSGTIHKRKTGYVATNPPGVSLDVLASTTETRLSPRFWLTSADGSERLVASAFGMLPMEAEASFSLRYLDNHPDTSPPVAPTPPPASAAPSVTPTPPPDANAEAEAERAFAALLDDLDPRDREQFERMIGLLQEHPKLARDAAARLIDAKTDDRVAAALADLLGTSGTPTAQRALLDVARNAQTSHMNALRAAIALGGVKNPTAEARQGLLDLANKRSTADAEDLGNTALLSMGVMADALRTQDAAASSALVRDLGVVLHNAAGFRQRIALKALGNAGTPEAEALVRPFLDAPDDATRSTAILALRRMPHAQSIYRQLLDKERNPQHIELLRRLLQE